MKPLAMGLALSVLWTLVVVHVPGQPGLGEKPAPAEKAGKGVAGRVGSAAWTLPEALEQLSLHPRDAYLQYVVLQLWRRHDRPDMKEFETLFAGPEQRQVDLLHFLPGTLALQEKLQFDVLTSNEPGAARIGPGPFGLAAQQRKADLPAEFVPGYTAASQIVQTIPSPGIAFPACYQWAPGLLPHGSAQELETILSQAVEKTRVDQERGEREKRRRQLVPVGELKGPPPRSPPWKDLLAGRNPPVSFLSRCVPEDFFLVEFRSAGKFLEALETLDQWAQYLVSQATFDARSRLAHERLRRQLLLENGGLERPWHDPVIGEVAVVGSDPFLQEGADVTVLCRLKQPKLFQAHLEGVLERIHKQQPDVRRVQGKHLDVEYSWLSSPDRSVHVFTANPLPDLHVRSNSRAALERVLEAIRGKKADGKPVPRLGDSAEYKYVRTVWPQDAAEEDGLVYVSEAFLHHLMSPRLKLTERRRRLCYNHLRMIGHAAQLYRTDHGKSAGSLVEIAKADCAPGEFNRAPLVCPDGGLYTLSADGQHGVCSHHGRAQALVPNCELPLELADGIEADLYNQYVETSYERFFAVPMALRIQLRPERYRVETLIPFQMLLGSKEQDQYRKALRGWTPEPLDALPVPRGNLFTLNFRLPTEQIFKDLEERAEQLLVLQKLRQEAAWLPNVAASQTGAPGAAFPAAMPWTAMIQPDVLTSDDEVRDSFAGLLNQYPALRKRNLTPFLQKGLGRQLGLHVYDARIMFDMNWAAMFADLLGQDVGSAAFVLYGFFLGPLVAPMYLSAPVQDSKIVDDFLDSLDQPLASLIRQRTNLGVGNQWIGPDFYKLTLRGGLQARALGFRSGAIRLRMFWARIGSGLYVTNNAAVLEDILDAELSRKNGAAKTVGPEGHVMLRLRPENWNAALPGFRLGWAEANREACYHNLGPLSSAARAFTATVPPKPKDNLSWDDRTRQTLRLAEGLHGAHHFCPDGGRYLLAKDGKTMTCSIHGASLAPRQAATPAAGSTLDRIIRAYAGFTGTLTFREDGVHAVVVIDRK